MTRCVIIYKVGDSSMYAAINEKNRAKNGRVLFCALLAVALVAGPVGAAEGKRCLVLDELPFHGKWRHDTFVDVKGLDALTSGKKAYVLAAFGQAHFVGGQDAVQVNREDSLLKQVGCEAVTVPARAQKAGAKEARLEFPVVAFTPSSLKIDYSRGKRKSESGILATEIRLLDPESPSRLESISTLRVATGPCASSEKVEVQVVQLSVFTDRKEDAFEPVSAHLKALLEEGAGPAAAIECEPEKPKRKRGGGGKKS
jgi:hypothetical protein